MIKTRIITFFSFLLILMGSVNLAEAITRIDITQGVVEPLPIAVNRFSATSLEDKELGNQIARVVEADLERSGLFRPIDRSAFIENLSEKNAIPTLASWRQINAATVVVGHVSSNFNGNLDIEFKLWDSYTEQQIAGTAYSLNPKLWRRAAHKIADEIYKRITGENGYFDTRIAYISETGPGTKKIKRLAIMDQDGENNQFLTDGKHLVLTPRFSPAANKLLYMAYADKKKPHVYIMDLETKRSKLLGNFAGMTLSPHFSPDGKKVIMSVSLNGSTDIYEMDLASSTTHRLTSDKSIDISPSYSPDGSQISFASDRGGSPQLYVMDKNGGNVKRITFGGGGYTTPVWSPRGDYIAFTKQSKGSFYIGVIKPDGSGERILTQGYLVEGPTWSPNGRVIMYTRVEPSYNKKSGASHIYSIDLTGYSEREIITPSDASDPAWSPLLP